MVRLVQQTMLTPDAIDDDAVSAGSDDTREQGDKFEFANKNTDSPNCQEECEDWFLDDEADDVHKVVQIAEKTERR